jgi:hypothetical protein
MKSNPIRNRIAEIDNQISNLLKSDKKEILIRLEWEKLARERYILHEQLDLIYKQLISRI